NELPAVLGHEMHHCVRSIYFPNPLTLWECIATEGLATHFERQMNGGIEPSLFKSFPELDWRELLDAARPLRDERAFSFHDWFLGGNPEKMPKYAGYFIGFKAVSGSTPITRTFLKRLKAPNHSSQLDVSSAD